MDTLIRIDNYFSMEELEDIADESWHTLDDFIAWYADCPPPVPMTPPDDGVYVDDIVFGIVMLRVKQFQVQLFICKPNAIIPDHIHPHADAAEVYISGMMFSKKGKTVLNQNRIDRRTEDGMSYPHGRIIRIDADDVHGAECSKQGGTFLTFQKWQDGHKPTSLGIDWEGQTVGEQHSEMIEDGKVFV
jgi:hypothetical protein